VLHGKKSSGPFLIYLYVLSMLDSENGGLAVKGKGNVQPINVILTDIPQGKVSNWQMYSAWVSIQFEANRAPAWFGCLIKKSCHFFVWSGIPAKPSFGTSVIVSKTPKELYDATFTSQACLTRLFSPVRVFFFVVLVTVHTFFCGCSPRLA